MADSVVSFLLDNLSQQLAQEANLLSGVEDKVTSLRNELKIINVFLKNSEGKRNEDEIVKEVVSQIRDVAHEAEDVVDTFIVNVIIRRRRNMLWKLVHCTGHALMLHDVAVSIEKINGTIKEIYANRNKYGIEEGESTRADTKAAETLRKQRRDVAENEEVVGFLHDSSAVIDKLMEGGSSRNVVSIIGMGGLGKTTLARKIYNNSRVKELFPCRAWGYVSNDYRARELLLSLLQCLLSTSEYNNLFQKRDEAEDDRPTGKKKWFRKHQDAFRKKALKQKVRECLSEKKYLVVIDDIWKTEVWDEVQDAFPNDNHNGSRILITSRIKEVAFYTSQTPPYYLPFLNDEESSELFCRKVFRGEEFPSDLKPLGRKMAESCGGLPLAIVVLGGLLANKEKSHRVWLKTVGSVNRYLTRDRTKVTDILKLSYDNLPRSLKPCFLYFGIYPEDYEIPARRLIQLWIAEGLIQETGTQNPEDVAEDYLDELVDRSLVQVASRRTDGGVKTCRVHDLLRDLCISESRDDKFLEVCTMTNIHNLRNPRRLSLHCDMLFYKSSTPCDHSSTRSLFYFGQVESNVDSSNWIWLLKSFKLGRVLDFGVAGFYSMTSPLKKLIHLRYLRIDSEAIHVIPDFICSLWNLETLDLRNSSIVAVPGRIWKLKRLRHLHMHGDVMLPDLSGSDDTTMWNLQTLSFVAFDSRTASQLDMGRFPNLRKLGLWCQKYENKSKQLEQLQSLRNLNNLRTLKLLHVAELPSLANAFSSNLTKITMIIFDSFDGSGMNTLGRLTNLQILKLSTRLGHGSFILNCESGGFPQLQVFQMVEINVTNWILEEGAMPLLRRLLINGCKLLNELPKELWSLSALNEVKALRPSSSLEKMLRNLEVKNGCKLVINPLSTY